LLVLDNFEQVVEAAGDVARLVREAANVKVIVTTRVVLRVYLKRDGGLASEPVLIEASASRDGPAVLQAAKNALKGCQPYAFLPADKYREWRVLDLSFTPRDMGG
jgi:hypothetical protein